ncbi:hypothetical protein PENVUL_c011G07255 [Penicillium vulpinum]|uniref:Nephrocystin 3-like N-terminal domain-containing protein n=2 Tax=Penicillium vulpinum TaxID=29845 RepID=A0A1V6S292_9EURO|nr:hypothetical protein PENVUL_c011G07255 [Penicillium vulpinum]
MAWQLATQKSSFAVHADEFCMKEDPGNNYFVWEKLFLNYFTESSSAITTCLVIDGIDEAEVEEQEVLFSLLEKAFSAAEDMSLGLSVRIVLISRDSVRAMLEEHSLDSIPDLEVGNNQNKEDLHQYVSQKLQKTKLFRGHPESLEETINDISQEAEGMWEWANLVIKAVLRCRTKEQIRKVVRTMPRGISAMLHEELQRLSKELSGWEESSGDEVSEGEGPASQIEQLKILLSFVTFAEKPLTVRQLDIILELVLKEEFMSLEDDIRTIYSSLFYIRANDNQDDFGDGGDVVTLRHSSFYDFFRMYTEPGPISVNIDKADTKFLYVFLYALTEDYTPWSERLIGDLRGYAEKFLPSYLTRANPEKAGNLREVISTLLADLFSHGQDTKVFIEEVSMRWFPSYSFYPTCRVLELGSYWLDAQDQDIANQRAEVVLHWFLPSQKQSFMDHARASAVGSDACPFTVLLSQMVASWSQRWLEPEEIAEDDGLPGIAPIIWSLYNSMANGVKDSDADGLTPKISDLIWGHGEPASVLIPAQLQRLQQTPMWHARVAQALLLKFCYAQALEHFQISLAKSHGTSIFSTQSMSVIHRNMARAFSEVAMHKEALEHLELSESLRSTSEENNNPHDADSVQALLNKAQMKHLAKMTDDAIATAEEAWNLVLQIRLVHSDMELLPFFSIFLELNQPHRLRSMLDLAFTPFEKTANSRSRALNFECFVLHSYLLQSRSMYRVLHHALTHRDQDYLDLIAGAVRKVDNELDSPVEFKYVFATLLFEKGQRDAGLQGWYEVASLSPVSFDKWSKPSHMRSISNLVALCLDDADIPFWGRPPLALNENSELGDVCLVLSSWLRDHRDITNARDALRWCVKECILLLSKDDPADKIDALVGLFRVFLVNTDSDEDLGAVLYLIKQDIESRTNVPRNMTGTTKFLDDDVQLDISSTFQNVQLIDEEEKRLDGDTDDYMDDDIYAKVVCDHCTGCSSCKREIGSIHHWYFCCSCAFSALCWRCYRQVESGDLSRISGICNPEHKFYYTGPLLRPSERVPEGMVPLISSDGKQQIIWIEDWKDRLAKKWETADFTFTDGLSAWCMRVLPEPQRARWALFFQT